MATAGAAKSGFIVGLGELGAHAVTLLGDFSLFASRTFGWMIRRRPAPHTLMPSFYLVGVRSVPVVAVTGMFIGMVMAVQMFNQFNAMGMATRLGSMINITLVRELGPVLAATMLAGRVGSAMAAELATMRITEQIDAWFNLLSDPTKARAISAGTEPGPRVHPEVVAAMIEVGVDLSGASTSRLTTALAQGAQMLITMGCGDQCPVVPGLKRDDWPLEDPKGKPLARVREIRDEIRQRVETLLEHEGWRLSAQEEGRGRSIPTQ